MRLRAAVGEALGRVAEVGARQTDRAGRSGLHLRQRDQLGDRRDVLAERLAGRRRAVRPAVRRRRRCRRCRLGLRCGGTGLLQRVRRLQRQRVRGHRVPARLQLLSGDRPLRRSRLGVRYFLVVGQRGVRELADQPRPLRRTVAHPHHRAGSGGGQLLRRRHGLPGRAGGQPSDRRQPSAGVRGLGTHGVRHDQCATDHTNAYLLAGTLPPVGTVCPANPNPFLPSVASAEPLFKPARR